MAGGQGENLMRYCALLEFQFHFSFALRQSLD